jgi:hypothetical protein
MLLDELSYMLKYNYLDTTGWWWQSAAAANRAALRLARTAPSPLLVVAPAPRVR